MIITGRLNADHGLSAPHGFEVVRARDVVRKPRFDADDVSRLRSIAPAPRLRRPRLMSIVSPQARCPRAPH